MGPLEQAIHGNEYGVIAITLGEFCDQVDQDNLPPMVQDAVGHVFPLGLLEMSSFGYRGYNPSHT